MFWGLLIGIVVSDWLFMVYALSWLNSEILRFRNLLDLECVSLFFPPLLQPLSFISLVPLYPYIADLLRTFLIDILWDWVFSGWDDYKPLTDEGEQHPNMFRVDAEEFLMRNRPWVPIWSSNDYIFWFMILIILIN